MFQRTTSIEDPICPSTVRSNSPKPLSILSSNVNSSGPFGYRYIHSLSSRQAGEQGFHHHHRLQMTPSLTISARSLANVHFKFASGPRAEPLTLGSSNPNLSVRKKARKRSSTRREREAFIARIPSPEQKWDYPVHLRLLSLLGSLFLFWRGNQLILCNVILVRLVLLLIIRSIFHSFVELN